MLYLPVTPRLFLFWHSTAATFLTLPTVQSFKGPVCKIRFDLICKSPEMREFHSLLAVQKQSSGSHVRTTTDDWGSLCCQGGCGDQWRRPVVVVVTSGETGEAHRQVGWLETQFIAGGCIALHNFTGRTSFINTVYFIHLVSQRKPYTYTKTYPYIYIHILINLYTYTHIRGCQTTCQCLNLSLIISTCV